MINFKKTFPTPVEHTKGVNTCEYIVVHHTATPEGTIQGVIDGLYRRPDYASVHYIIDVNGDIYKLGNDTDILWHAGVSSWKGKNDLNNYSIGIEVIGPLKAGGFTDEERSSLRLLISDLMKTHNLTPDRIIRHKDIAPKRKTDIDDSFWKKEFATWGDYQNSYIDKPKETMNQYAIILDEELKKNPDYTPIFADRGSDKILTEKETKSLIEIACLRLFLKLKK